MPDVTFAAKVVTALLLAGLSVAPSAASPPHYTFRDVALVTLVGRGTVRSLPLGIDCPRTCRALFPRGTHLRLQATAAPGWRFAGFTSKWCNVPGMSCVFDLVSPHDCIGGACPLGAFGVRARFVRR